jgi:transposase
MARPARHPKSRVLYSRKAIPKRLRERAGMREFNVLDGTVIDRNMQRHRHQEFIRFLNTAEAQVLARKAIHAIVDNYATHKHPKVRQWLVRHPRWTFHFTPTSASWLNAVEGFFAKLSRRRLKRGVFRSLADLQAAINRFVNETNDDPKPFTWTADPNKIIAAVRRGHQVLDSIHYGARCGVGSGSRTTIAGFSSGSIESFHRSRRWSLSFVPRRSCIGIARRPSLLLAMAVSLTGKVAADRDEPPGVDPVDERGESALGSAAHPR